MAGKICDVCGGESIGIASSGMGPISFSYCSRCISEGYEPYFAIVAGSFGLRKETIPPTMLSWVLYNLEFHNKTEDQFWLDVLQLEGDFYEHASY